MVYYLFSIINVLDTVTGLQLLYAVKGGFYTAWRKFVFTTQNHNIRTTPCICAAYRCTIFLICFWISSIDCKLLCKSSGKLFSLFSFLFQKLYIFQIVFFHTAKSFSFIFFILCLRFFHSLQMTNFTISN